MSIDGKYVIDQPFSVGPDGREHESGAPTDMVEAGQELIEFLETYVAHPSAEAKTDLFYASEKLTLSVTGWAHWEENGRPLLRDALDAASAIEHGKASTLDAVKTALDKLICLD